ncbi:ATP-binding protein [Streptomyces coffeae]|uniref:ATP-binding protein n=1 Tax=Streptomyces coffeae TaxID=621382 RepID=A0ABS1NLQ0_9ACTN|nr:ATP-binding protein [Streptomyces coffeae]MBL1100918.1 ATP-binding protein [Streptomyces coffeae]
MNVSTPQLPPIPRLFTQRLSSTRRGARLARLFAVEQLRTWPVSPSLAGRAEGVIAELAANAASHGRVQGRDFRLTLTHHEATGTLRIEVADTLGEKLPTLGPVPGPDSETGRGLHLVAAFADRWGTQPHECVGKTVWAELDPSS